MGMAFQKGLQSGEALAPTELQRKPGEFANRVIHQACRPVDLPFLQCGRVRRIIGSTS